MCACVRVRGWLCHTWAPSLGGWLSEQWHQQRMPTSWRYSADKALVKHSTPHSHCSYQRFLLSLPCPSLPFLACLPFSPVHIPPALPTASSTAAPHPWADPIAGPLTGPTPQTGGLPLGFLENHLLLSEQPAQPRNTAAEFTGTLWPWEWCHEIS